MAEASSPSPSKGGVFGWLGSSSSGSKEPATPTSPDVLLTAVVPAFIKGMPLKADSGKRPKTDVQSDLIQRKDETKAKLRAAREAALAQAEAARVQAEAALAELRVQLAGLRSARTSYPASTRGPISPLVVSGGGRSGHGGGRSSADGRVRVRLRAIETSADGTARPVVLAEAVRDLGNGHVNVTP